MLVGRSTFPSVFVALLGCVIVSMNENVVVEAGCCSQKHKTCDVSGCDSSATYCEESCWGGNSGLVFLPQSGAENSASCVPRWSGTCYSSADCCGTLYCRTDWKQCVHPQKDYCSSFNKNSCPTSDGTCKVSGSKCVAAVDYTHTALATSSVASPTKAPTSSPTKSPTEAPVAATCSTWGGLPAATLGSTTTNDVVWLDTEADSWCEAVNNLGQEYSASTSYEGEFPVLAPTGLNARGYDDAITFLVGGNYYAPLAAEIEGRSVVLGNFVIGDKGTNTMGAAGIGSGIFASPDTVHLAVGGDLDGGKTDGQTWFTQGASVEFGGCCNSTIRNTKASDSWPYPDEKACGSMFVPFVDGVSEWEGNYKYTIGQKTMDRTPYIEAFSELQTRSEYWYSLKPNGVITQGDSWAYQRVYLSAGDDRCVQVFHLDYELLSDLREQSWGEFYFDSSLVDKTILINVSPFDANGNLLDNVDFSGISLMFDSDNKSNYDFSPKMKSSMMWNFYNAKKVTIGPLSNLIMPGSLIVPYGDLDFFWPGQDGRTMVYGDLLHNAQGSEFHNYEFDPICPLPLPPSIPTPSGCDGPKSCVITLTEDDAGVAYPDGAVSVVASDGETVSFKIEQLFKSSTVSWVQAMYTRPGESSLTCDSTNDKEDGVPAGDFTGPYTAQCDGMFATVLIAVHDGQFKGDTSNDNNYGCGGWPKGDGVALYELSLPCCDNGVTLPPAPAPTKSPTAGPTKAPVVSPTNAPVPAPTNAPVPAPTNAPVPAPTKAPVAPTGGSDCEVTLTEDDAGVAYPDGAVSVVESDGNTVSFKIEQLFKSSTVSWVQAMYTRPGESSLTCDSTNDKEDGVPAGDFTGPYTAQCDGMFATVLIAVHDGQFKGDTSNDNNYGCGGWPKGDGVALYELSVPCCGGGSPVASPTDAPVASPTDAPVASPTKAPVPSPTNSPVSTSGGYTCELPEYMRLYTFVTKENANIAAHNTYTGFVVGTEMYVNYNQQIMIYTNTSSGLSSSEQVSYYQSFSGTNIKTNAWEGSRVQCNNCEFKEVSDPLATAGIDWAQLEWLATHMTNSSSNEFSVHVVDHGGEFHQCQFIGDVSGSDDSRTLVVFNTDEDIVLTTCPTGKKWGPSVIAPFATVTLKSGNDYTDGIVYAKSFISANNNQQIHGNYYVGPIECEDDDGTPVCSLDYENTDTTICADDYDTVVLTGIKTADGSIVPDTLHDPSSIFYALEHIDSDTNAPLVSFKVENPFDFGVDMYVQYDAKVEGTSHGALDPACDQFLDKMKCDLDAEAVTAGCIVPANGPPFTIVSVFFVSEDSSFGSGSSTATPYECCEVPEEDESKPIIEYTFKVLCGCPPEEESRRDRHLLRSPSKFEF